MKNRVLILAGLFIFSLAAIWAYKSNYELRLVPNKPDLRPKAVQPSPQELNPNFQLSGGSERDTRGFPQRKIVDLSSMFPGLFYLSGDRHEKKVALTFDDGPDSVYTPQILDILKENGVKATFFLIGNRANLFPEMVKRIIQEGHVVGNHSMTHPDIMKLDKTQTKEEIQGPSHRSENILYGPFLLNGAIYLKSQYLFYLFFNFRFFTNPLMANWPIL